MNDVLLVHEEHDNPGNATTGRSDLDAERVCSYEIAVACPTQNQARSLGKREIFFGSVWVTKPLPNSVCEFVMCSMVFINSSNS